MLNVPYVIGAKPQSAVVTQPVTLNAAQTITVLNSGTCVLLKNGEAQSTPCSYAAGDSLQVRIVSGVAGHTVFAVLGSSIDSDLSVVAVTAAEPVLRSSYPGVRELRALDLLTYSDGSPFVPNSEDDLLLIGRELADKRSLDLPKAVTYSQESWLLLTDCLNYRIRLFNVNGRCCYEKHFDSHPAGSWCEYGNKFSVCLPEENKVLVLSLGTSIREDLITAFTEPVSASLSSTGSSLWVGHSGGVSRWTNRVVFTVPLTDVREVLAMSEEACFVTTHSGEFGIVTAAGYVKAGNAYVRAACLHAGNVVFIEGDTLHSMSLSGTLTSSYAFPAEEFPASVASNGTEIAVGTFGKNLCFVFDSNLTFKASWGLTYSPYGIAYVGGILAIAALYVNRPPVAYVVDKTPAQFDVSDSQELQRNASASSLNVTVRCLEDNTPIRAAIPDILGATLYKNGVASGLSTDVVSGDVLRIAFTTPAGPHVGIKLPLFVGQVFDDLISTTLEYDVTPNAFTFTDVTEAVPSSEHTSEEITIAGLDADAPSATISVSSGILYKNGVATGQSATIKNGDKIKVGLSAPDSKGSAAITSVTAGRYKTDWAISTPALDQFFIAESLIDTAEQLWPTTGGVADTVNSLAVVPSSMSAAAVTHVNLSAAPTGKTYSGEQIVVLVDLRTSTIYEVNTGLASVQRAYHPSDFLIRGSFFLDNADFGGIGVFLVTNESVVAFSSDYRKRWGPVKVYYPYDTQTHGIDEVPYTHIVDGVAVDGGLTLFFAHAEGAVSKHAFNAVRGTVGLANTVYPFKAQRFLLTSMGGVDYTFAYGTGGIKQLTPEVKDITDQKCLTLAFDGQYLYTVDRYYNRILVYTLDKTLVKAVKMPFACGELAMCGSSVMAADLSGHRIVKLNSELEEVSAVSVLAGPINLVASDTTVCAYERLSNVRSDSVLQDAITLTNVQPITGAVPQSTVSETIALTGAVRPAKTVAGSAIIASTVSNGAVGVSAPASADYDAKQTAKFAINSSVSSLEVYTKPNTTPDWLFFGRAYEDTVGTLVDSYEQPIKGLTPGHSAQLSVEQGLTTAVLVVNGNLVGSTATVSNDDLVAVRVLVDNPYGATHKYNVSAEGVVVGTFVITSDVSRRAIKFPGMHVRRNVSYPNVETTRVSSTSAYSPDLLGASSSESILSLGSPVCLPDARVKRSKSSAKVVQQAVLSSTLSMASTASTNISFLRPYSGSTVSQEVRASTRVGPYLSGNACRSAARSPFEQLRQSYGIEDQHTPFFIRPHLFLCDTKRLESTHLPVSFGELRRKTYDNVSPSQCPVQMFDWYYPANREETVPAQYDKALTNCSFHSNGWSSYAYSLRDFSAEFRSASPAAQYPVQTDWSTFGRRYETVSVQFGSGFVHRETFNSSADSYQEHREGFYFSPLSAHPTAYGEFKCLPRVSLSASVGKFEANPVRSGYAHLTKFQHSGISKEDPYREATLASSDTFGRNQYSAHLTGSISVHNLNTFRALTQHVLSEEVWTEQPITPPENKGLFSSEERAEANAKIKAKHAYRIVPFKDAYFWTEDVEVPTKTCYSYGSMSRTPYAWNMQLRNCWSAAKKSGYVGGG